MRYLLLIALCTLHPALFAAPLSVEAIGWKASGKGGAVAAGKPEAVAAGIELLSAGGNAADAAAATLLALAVTDYGLFAIGGEVPLLIFDAKKQEVKALCGLGRAPLAPEATKWFFEHGIPSGGDLRAAATPGAVDLCVTLLRLYGTKSFGAAVAPTLRILDRGELSWHGDLARTLRRLVEREEETNGDREEKLTAARDRFYKGDIADELEAWYIAEGAFLRKQDLASHVTRLEDPVSVDFRGYRVYKCGPWTQGPVLCQALRILEGFDLKSMGHLSADYIHVVTEALKLAFADRDAYYGDPLFVESPLRGLFTEGYSAMRRRLVSLTSASRERVAGDPFQGRGRRHAGEPARPGARTNIPIQDTTTCVVADRWGNVIAATPSCNVLTNVPGPLGVTHGNRVRSLNTTLGHPNRVQPGKRPRITLTPTLVTRRGKPVIAISVAGGDLQDQTTLNVLLNRIEFDMLPDVAVTRPRFATAHHQNSFDPNPDRDAAFGTPGKLRINREVPVEVVEDLMARGHGVAKVSGALAHPVMLYLEAKTGLMFVAGDPKAGRHAAVLQGE